MFNSQVIDVAIGLMFVYFVLSLLASITSEFISQIFRMRWQTLATAIANVFSNQELLQSFFEQPVIRSLALKQVTVKFGNNSRVVAGGQGPSYIPSNLFARAVTDLVHLEPTGETPPVGAGDGTTAPATNTPQNNAELILFITRAVQDEKLRALLLSIAGVDTKTLEEFRVKLATWYDQYMERVSGWYKRRTQYILLGLGLVLAVLLNADTVTMANALLANPTLRDSVTRVASEYVATNPSPTTAAGGGQATSSETPITSEELKTKIGQISSLQTRLASLNLPILWLPADPTTVDPREVPSDLYGWLYKIVGLLVTALLVSLGAPFWFDLLSRITNLRAAGKPPEKHEVVVADSGVSTARPGGAGGSSGTLVSVPVQPSVGADNAPRRDFLIDRVADDSISYVEALEASGNKLTRDEEIVKASRFVAVEMARFGRNLSGDQIQMAVQAALDRRRPLNPT